MKTCNIIPTSAPLLIAILAALRYIGDSSTWNRISTPCFTTSRLCYPIAFGASTIAHSRFAQIDSEATTKIDAFSIPESHCFPPIPQKALRLNRPLNQPPLPLLVSPRKSLYRLFHWKSNLLKGRLRRGRVCHLL